MRAFTLIELLVVVGLIAILSAAVFQLPADGGSEAAMRSAQAIMRDLVTVARTRAPATGHKTRLLVNVDAGVPERYLRLVVLQIGRQAGASPADWDSLQRIALPTGVFVVPAALDGVVTAPSDWKRASDPTADLSSDLFSGQSLAYALEGDTAPQSWTGVAFTPAGTLAALAGGLPPKGSLVLAPGRRREVEQGSGAPPVTLENPKTVRGLLLSAYGVPALLPNWNAF
jgi:prepilin-type N-terminal cleavage/methylation domain-containing protein